MYPTQKDLGLHSLSKKFLKHLIGWQITATFIGSGTKVYNFTTALIADNDNFIDNRTIRTL